ncbi:MAG: universal stress protein [Saprospiraceae bacterium]|nr:universal stress protein [Saprospiraceae bacterium]MCB9345850.1 universal stress protein [Lewinellaceae bacterium]
MKEISTYTPESCTGDCQGCGKTHIKVFGAHNTASQLLRARVMLALEATGLDGKVLEVSEPGVIQVCGVSSLPALMVEGRIMAEGIVPSVDQIIDLLKHQNLYRSKLFRMRSICVPVDLSPEAANALKFAWNVANQLKSNLEVIYAMDSIFEGSEPSASGFLSGYQTTMKKELDNFITESLDSIGVAYSPAKGMGNPGTPANPNSKPFISSRVIYGAPDVALTEYSKEVDMMVMGTTGRGNIGKKFFGSVSIEVSKTAHSPTIFVPKEAEFRGFQQMLYASDFDSLNPLSVQQATTFAKRFDGQIHFVHVGAGGEKGLDEQRKVFEAEYGEANPDRPFIFSKMVSEDIAGALYEYSFYHRIDLLVFVTHHRNFWDTILHKSITNIALLSSDIPVLIIHSDNDLINGSDS